MSLGCVKVDILNSLWDGPLGNAVSIKRALLGD